MSTSANSNSNQLLFSLACKQCRTIIGDTVALKCNVDILNIIVLSDAKNVIVAEKVKSAKQGGGEEESISYRVINCKNCSHLLGRKYVTISSYPDIQGDYSFSLDKAEICDYEPGPTTKSEEKTAEPLESAMPLTPVPAQIELTEDIIRLKKFCLILSDTQDSLSEQVKQLDDHSLPEKQVSIGEELEKLKSRFDKLEESLQTVIESQKRLVEEMQIQRKRSYNDFRVEIPSVDKALLRTSRPSERLSPATSMGSEEQNGKSETRSHKSTENLPREVDSGEPPIAKRAPQSIFLSDDDVEGETAVEAASQASKRTRLSKKKSRGRGGPRASTGSIASETRLIDVDPQEKRASLGRVSKSQR